MLSVVGIVAVSAVLLSVLAVRALHRLGDYSADIEAGSVERQAGNALYGLVRERAMRHDVQFQNAAAFTRAIAERGAYYLEHIDLYGREGAWGEEPFEYRADKGVLTNPPYALVSSVYWDRDTLEPAVRRRINALSHLDEFLASAMLNHRGAAASWLMLRDTVVRYFPNRHMVDMMPPKWEFDLRRDPCFLLGTPEHNPTGATVWSDVYQDTVGQGLVVTVASAFYTSDGAFQGVTGLDFSLDGMVREVLHERSGLMPKDDAPSPVMDSSGFSMLLDREGFAIALPLERAGMLGLGAAGQEPRSPGQRVKLSMRESSSPGVRALVGDMIAGRSGLRRVDIDGQTFLAAFHPLVSTGWSLAELAPLGVVLAPVGEIRAALQQEVLAIASGYPLAAFGVMVFASLLIVPFLLRRLCHPMRRLLAATQAVSLGDLDHVVPIPRDDEFDDLGRAFNAMIVDLRRHEERLREAEEKYRSIFESAVEGIYQSTPGGEYLNVNGAMARALGYKSPEDMLRGVRNIAAQVYVTPADRALFFERLEAEGEVLQFETRLRRKDGGIIWARLGGRAVYGPDGKMTHVNGVLEDFTDAQNAREQIRYLSQELMRAQERERGRIARDLHDGVAQNLSSLKIAAGVLFDGHPGVPDELRGRAEDLSRRLQECIGAVRDMAYDLRPASLDELGLVRTLEQYCREFTERTGVRTDFMAAGMEGVALTPESEINLYRLAQEALNNVEKHSRADQVEVRLVASHPKVILCIVDNGRGFAPSASGGGGRRRMGLRSMEERARLMGGSLQVSAQPGRGVRLKVEVPAGKGGKD